MILRSLTLQNYGPFRGEHQIDLSPQGADRRRNICLVGALNGSGKTSLLEAVLIALYGQRARIPHRQGLAWKDYLRAARNRDAKPAEPSGVVLCFDHPDARGLTSLRVSRRWRVLPRGGVPDTLEVDVQDPDRRWHTDRELTANWAERVEALVPVGLSSLYFFDGEQVRVLAAQEIPPEDVQEAIRSLLGLDLPHRLVQDLEILIARRQRDLVAPLDMEKLRAHQTLVDELTAEEAQARAKWEGIKREVEQHKTETQRVREVFIAAGADLSRRRDELEKKLAASADTVARIRGELIALSAGALPLNLLGGLIARALEGGRRDLQHEERLLVADHLRKRDEEVEAILRDLGVRGSLIKKLASRLASPPVTPASRGIGAGLTREALMALEKMSTEGVQEAIQQAKLLQERLASAQVNQETLASRLRAAPEPEEASRLTEALERTSQRLGAVEQNLVEAEEALLRLTRERGQAEARLRQVLSAFTATKAKESTSVRMVGAAERVSLVLEQYALRLKEKKLAKVEMLVAEQLGVLARKSDWVASVVIDPEHFGITLFDSDGRAMDKSRLSAGEQQLLAVAFLWALSLASGRNLPLVIDTPLGRMDSEHRTALIEHYFPIASHQVILLSTDTEIDAPTFRQLDALGVIDRSYHIEYDSAERSSYIRTGYRWS